jgi:diguanylate cyclase (GGDEF)-like protein
MILLPLASSCSDVRGDPDSVGTMGAALVPLGEFGPFDALADRAHRLYMDGFSERAVRVCRESAVVSTGAGDRITTRYLRYIEGISLQEVGRHQEAVTVARDLLADMEGDSDLMWRAKALALLAESAIQIREVSQAMDALAEGSGLVEKTRPGRYGHLSASMAVAMALRAVFLFEQSDALLLGIRLGDDLEVNLLVVQERALLSAFWGTTLLVVGQVDAATPLFVKSAERALWMGRIARLLGNSEMAARAEVVEAYALGRLGHLELAAARVTAAIQGFSLRDELIETHLSHLVLGQAATEAGDYDQARWHLMAALKNADSAKRDIWSAAAIEALADLNVVEHGSHPAIDLWKRLAREALERVWVERHGRFAALRSRQQVRSLTAETDRISHAALRDELTGLGNRQMMTNTIDGADGDLCAVFVDIDEFKQINDCYSHAIGDQVLRRLADILTAQCRSGDVAVRYGGDEFVILVFGGGAAAQEVARRLHYAVRNALWEQVAPGLMVTVSVGVGRQVPAAGAIAGADAALYAAKRAGRDCVVSV